MAHLPTGVSRRLGFRPAFLGALVVTACVTPRSMFVAYVDTTREYGQPGHGRYVLVPADRGMDPEGEAFLRIADYVERALALEGYEAAPCSLGDLDCPEADLAIFVGYGVRTLRIPYTFSEPACAAPLYRWDPNLYGPGMGGSRRVGPVCRPIGYFEYEGHYARYTTRLTLSALDLARQRASKSPRRPFGAVLTTEAVVYDLDRVLPVLLAASRGLLGRDSGAELEVPIDESDPRVCAITDRTDCTAPVQAPPCERCHAPLHGPGTGPREAGSPEHHDPPPLSSDEAPDAPPETDGGVPADSGS